MSYFLGYMSPETDFARQIEYSEGELNRKLEPLRLGAVIYVVGGKLKVEVRKRDDLSIWRQIFVRSYGTWDEFLSNRESEIDQIVFEATFRC
jgi:hypothetical protein